MKNIYFGIALAVILTFSTCSDDDDEPKDKGTSPSSSSGLGSGACYMNAQYFALCFKKIDNAGITAEKCAEVAQEYYNVPNEIRESCPEGETAKCNDDKIDVYTYGTTPMPCESLLNVL